MENPKALLTALDTHGLTAELLNTGGNVMVAFIQVGEYSIGIDESSVCIYKADDFDGAIYYHHIDEEIDYKTRTDKLAKLAKLLKTRIEENN